MADEVDSDTHTTRQQMQYLLDLRAYVHEEAGWIRTLTETIQRGVAGEETATQVGQVVADVAAPYRAEMARLRALTTPPGCEAVAGSRPRRRIPLCPLAVGGGGAGRHLAAARQCR